MKAHTYLHIKHRHSNSFATSLVLSIPKIEKDTLLCKKSYGNKNLHIFEKSLLESNVIVFVKVHQHTSVPYLTVIPLVYNLSSRNVVEHQ